MQLVPASPDGDVINNMRTRINALEMRLQNVGLLALPSGIACVNPATIRFFPHVSAASLSVDDVVVTGNAPTVSIDSVDISNVGMCKGLAAFAEGQATITPTSTGGLQVSNIGSSGQDGVSIELRSLWGGGITFDASPLLAGGGEMRIRPRGWDGTIKGRLDFTATSTGCQCTCDPGYYGTAATRVIATDAFGNVVADQTVAAGPLTLGLHVNTDPGTIPLFHAINTKGTGTAGRSVALEFAGCTCDVSGLVPGAVVPGVARLYRIVLEADTDGDGQYEVVARARGIPTFTVTDANLGTFGAECRGIRDVQIGEVCDDGNNFCGEDLRRLPVRNIGSSGQDGVAINWPKGARINTVITLDGTASSNPSSTAMEFRCRDCSPGHVTLMKITEDVDPAAGRISTTADPTGAGVTQCEVFFLDASGHLVGHAVVDPTVPITEDFTAASLRRRCKVSEAELNLDAIGPRTVTIPGVGTFPNVQSFRYTLKAGVPIRFAPDAVQITSNAPDGFTVESLTASQSVSVAGITCAAAGGAVLGDPAGRRLPVRNIGSSGQDGVDVQLSSVWGGSVGVDLTPLLGGDPTLSREIRIRPRGWDGTIKGALRNSNTPGNADIVFQHFDGPDGMTGCSWSAINPEGEVVRAGESSGPTLDWSARIHSMPGQPVLARAINTTGTGATVRTMRVEFSAPAEITGLPGGDLDNVHAIRIDYLDPDDDNDGISDLEVTATGLPEFAIDGPALHTFNVGDWAIYTGTLWEKVDNSGIAELVADNLGSSGQDGVTIDIGPGASGATFRSKKCPDCPPGHVTLIKFYDEAGREAFHATTIDDPASGEDQHYPDFSARGSTLIQVTVLDAAGNPTSSHVMANGDPLDPLCPNGAIRVWQWDFSCGCVRLSCVGMTLQLTPIGPVNDPPVVRYCDHTSNAERLYITGVTVTTPPVCGSADFNHDGDLGTDADIEAFFACLAGNCCAACGTADFNADGDLGTDADIESFFRVLAGGSC